MYLADVASLTSTTPLTVVITANICPGSGCHDALSVVVELAEATF